MNGIVRKIGNLALVISLATGSGAALASDPNQGLEAQRKALEAKIRALENERTALNAQMAVNYCLKKIKEPSYRDPRLPSYLHDRALIEKTFRVMRNPKNDQEIIDLEKYDYSVTTSIYGNHTIKGKDISKYMNPNDLEILNRSIHLTPNTEMQTPIWNEFKKQGIRYIKSKRKNGLDIFQGGNLIITLDSEKGLLQIGTIGEGGKSQLKPWEKGTMLYRQIRDAVDKREGLELKGSFNVIRGSKFVLLQGETTSPEARPVVIIQ